MLYPQRFFPFTLNSLNCTVTVSERPLMRWVFRVEVNNVDAISRLNVNRNLAFVLYYSGESFKKYQALSITCDFKILFI